MRTIAIATMDEFGVVLQHNDVNTLTPFVTHEFRVNEPDCTYLGHYYKQEREARSDFIERVIIVLRAQRISE